MVIESKNLKIRSDGSGVQRVTNTVSESIGYGVPEYRFGVRGMYHVFVVQLLHFCHIVVERVTHTGHQALIPQ
jgi:hypothetical protein